MIFLKILLTHIVLLSLPTSNGSPTARYLRPESNKRKPRHQRITSNRGHKRQTFEGETSNVPEWLDGQDTAENSSGLSSLSGVAKIPDSKIFVTLFWFLL